MLHLGISVIICCYNSAQRLPETLDHLSKQKLLATINWEIIVVDNNSIDDTSNVAKKAWQSLNSDVPFTVIREPIPGLSNARRTGVKNASFEFILFCDDDNWLERNYLSHAYDVMCANPNIGVLGGQSEACFEVEAPLWFKHFAFAYALGKQLPATGLANKRKYIAGAGMVVRKQIFETLDRIGFQNLLSDRKGKNLSSGGDSELCLIILFLGYDLYYDEQLKFTHFIPAKRLTWSYCSNMISESFSVPQVYYNFYNLLNDSVVNKKSICFDHAYKIALNKSINVLSKQFKGVKSFYRATRSLVVSKKGSMKDIHVRAGLKRLAFLLKNKERLRQEFEDMQKAIKAIDKEKIHHQVESTVL